MNYSLNIIALDGMSEAMAANPWIILLVVLLSMLGSRHIFQENNANVPTTREGKCFEGAAY